MHDAIPDSAIALDDEILILQKNSFLNISQPHKKLVICRLMTTAYVQINCRSADSPMNSGEEI